MSAGQFSDLVHMLSRSIKRFGHRRLFGTKVDGQWQWLDYRAFGHMVDEIRAGLRHAGIRRGDTVAIISGNRVEWAAVAYATYGLGALLAPMYEHQHEDDWRYILNDSGASLLIVSTAEIHGRLSEWTGQIGALDKLFCMELPEGNDDSLAALRHTGRQQPFASIALTPEDLCGFIYTSGTTGKPKGVLLSHGNIVSNINAVHSFVPMNRDDTSLSFLPWAHSFGQTCELHCMVSLGCTVAFAESVETLAENMLEVRPTVLFAVPRVFNRIYHGVHKRVRETGGLRKRLFDLAMRTSARRRHRREEGRPSIRAETLHPVLDRLVFDKVRARFGGRLRFAFSGGAALSAEVATFMDDLGIMVLEGYGLTETSPIACANSPMARRIGSVGRAIDGVEVTIDTSVLDDDSGHGEILIKGPNVMQGYHNLPEVTAEVMTEDGAFRTGDRGYIDDDGFVWITGRIKEQYKLENGKYVVPAPLEAALQLSPCIDQVFVYGMNRPFNVALVVPDRDAVEKWAAGQGIDADWQTLLGDRRTRALLDGELARYGAQMRGFERPRMCGLLADGFTIDNGMMTPKMSLKRAMIESTYADLLEELYA